MRGSIGLLVAVLSLLLKTEGAAHSGHCTGKQCFALYHNSADFETAQTHCKREQGHLMTVRSVESHNIVSRLLGNLTGQYWIGLRLPNGECPNNATALRGYRWISGDDDGARSDFHNWGTFDSSCSPCASVSAADKVWMEEKCDNRIDGFLCEYSVYDSCNSLHKGEESVMYRTYYGFEVKDLPSLPMGTIAIHSTLKSKSICLESAWWQAPWGCEIVNGGCDYKCLQVNKQYTCDCPPGKTLHSNKVSCRVIDPCDELRCAHLCARTEDSYECGCRRGYALEEDGKGCRDIDECARDRQCPGDHAECVNTPGGFGCTCQKGYELENDQCVLENPCSSSPCEHDCVATRSRTGYSCSCRAGFSVSKVEPTMCDRVCHFEECPTECDPNTHQCRCPRGYMDHERNGKTFCLDIDECEGYAYCAQNCTNTYGGFLCSCHEGYDLVDESCEKSPITTDNEFSPPVVSPSARPSEAKAGSVLGIIVCTVGLSVILVITVTYHTHKRCCACGKFEVALKSKDNDIYYLQQVTTEKYKKLSFDGQQNSL